VAAGAQGMGHRFFEVAVLVAAVALNFGVCAVKRKRRAVVVERRRRPHLLPAAGAMAVLAVSLKCAPVRILMATAARFKRKIPVLDVRFAVSGQRAVAAVARYLFMQAGERVSCVGVIESGRRFPTYETVALGAIRIQLAAMFVGVARGATAGEPEISMVGRLHPDDFPGGWRHVVCRVAAFAGDSGVLAHQRVTGLPMIEVVVRRFPFDDVEPGAQMFGVAADAVLVTRRTLHDSGVETLLADQAFSDLPVAAGAPELSHAQSEAVTGGALGSALQAGMRLRKKSRGNLCLGRQTGDGQDTA